MRLYEIDQSLRALWDKINEQEGELTPEDMQALEELNLAKDEKIKGYGVIIRELDNQIQNCATEISRLKAISDKLENRRERLADHLKYFMQLYDIPKFESPEVNIGFRKSKSLFIDENANVPKEFMRVVETPNRKAITDFIKAGGTVDGCQLVEKENIQIK